MSARILLEVNTDHLDLIEANPKAFVDFIRDYACFMNVIAYLNGEAQITDKSECVCFVMRPMAIYAYHLFNDDDRQKLLPFILRALGSRTDDKAVITERLRHVVAFAEKQGQYAANYAKYADWYAAKYAKYAAKHAAESAKSAKSAKSAESAAESAEYAYYAKHAVWSAEFAAKYAAESAKYVDKYAVWSATKYADWYNTTRDDLLALFDDVCLPQLTEPQAVHIERAKRLHEMAQA